MCTNENVHLPLGYNPPSPKCSIFHITAERMDSKVSFLAFCNLCEHLGRLQKVEQKKQKLCGFIEEWRKEDPHTIYSFIRLLLPHVRIILLYSDSDSDCLIYVYIYYPPS